MGLCNATEEDLNSKVINKLLMEERKKLKTNIKILLLGTGASGKTTLVKQMRIAHKNEFKEDKEKIFFREFIHENVFYSMKNLIKKLDTNQEIPNEHKEIIELLKEEKDFEKLIGEEHGKQIENLWKSDLIQNVFHKNYEYRLYDADTYFLNNLERICTSDYIPTIDDILRVRVKTTGIQLTQFKSNGYNFNIVDVGGQRSERRKWFHCFDDVSTLIFVAALNDYERILEEDLKTNRLAESIELFDLTLNSKFFEDKNFILFLNKKDIFEERITASPLSKFFQDYSGSNDYKPSLEYIRDKYLSKNTKKDRNIYFHETNAVDTKNFKILWGSIQEYTLTKALEASNLF